MSDDIARGETIARSGKYAPTASPNGQVDDHIPPPTESDEPHDPGRPDDAQPHTDEDTGQKRYTRGGADPDDPTAWEKAVRNRTIQLRIDREARQRVDQEMRPAIDYPPVRSLDALLAADFPPQRYRIGQVAPTNARVLLSAQYKAGKSTLVGNLMRSLADCVPFLGAFFVHTPATAIVLIDDEMSERTVQEWLAAQNIANTAAVADVITLRGSLGAFNLLDEQCRAQWAQRLAGVGCDYLILDCLRPLLDALGLDENHDAGVFLVAFDALMKEAGVPDACLVQHMGHSGERARGDSRYQDWPDAIWRLVREYDDPASPRYFSAYGRDVDVREGRLSFDPATRHLSYAGGSRGDAKTEAAKSAVIGLLAASDEPLNKKAIETELVGEHIQKAVRAGIKSAVEDGFVTVETGPRGAKLHSIAYPCSECGLPVASQRGRHESCPSGPDELGFG